MPFHIYISMQFWHDCEFLCSSLWWAAVGSYPNILAYIKLVSVCTDKYKSSQTHSPSPEYQTSLQVQSRTAAHLLETEHQRREFCWNWHPSSELLAHISPPVSAHAQGEVHYRCPAVSQEGFWLSPSHPTEELPVLFCISLRPGQWRGKAEGALRHCEEAGPHHRWKYLSACTLPSMQASLQVLEMFYVQKTRKLFWV